MSSKEEWVRDIEDARQPHWNRRWTNEELDDLQIVLNSEKLGVVSNAIGSLRFDLTEAKGNVTRLTNGQLALLNEKDKLQKQVKRLTEASEMLWVVLANVSEGDWSKQTEEWQKAAIRWRDNHFAALSVPAVPTSSEEK